MEKYKHALKKRRDSSLNEICCNGVTLRGEKLAKAFNNCFISIVGNFHGETTTKFRKSPVENSISINPTNENEMMSTFTIMKDIKSCDVDGL